MPAHVKNPSPFPPLSEVSMGNLSKSLFLQDRKAATGAQLALNTPNILDSVGRAHPPSKLSCYEILQLLFPKKTSFTKHAEHNGLKAVTA